MNRKEMICRDYRVSISHTEAVYSIDAAQHPNTVLFTDTCFDWSACGKQSRTVCKYFLCIARWKSYFLILKICEAWHHAVVGVTDEEVVGVTGASLEQHHMRKRNNKIKAQLRKTFQNKLEQ